MNIQKGTRAQELDELSISQHRWLSLAANEAHNAPGPFMVGAVLIKGGRVLAVESNRRRNNPMFTNAGWSIHAEAAALVAASRCSVNGSTLYVARVTPGGRLGLAQPCPKCAWRAKRAGVTRVVFTGDDEEVYRWNLVKANLPEPTGKIPGRFQMSI